ncbi:MAG: M23 family metallopeptidase [Acidimicrobiia bacterium]|nr:M23 family metallopeptidase [Acidimicrobiia bacterium]
MNYLFRSLALAFALWFAVAPSASAAEDFRLVYFPHEDVRSDFHNDWGNARSGGRRHKGTDIFAAKHSKVVAVADGFVTAMGKSGRAGYYVRITHQDGWESWYMHLNNDNPGSDDGSGGLEAAFPPGLEEGMYIPAGTVVGFVGDSGNAEATSPHTHFELHTATRRVNPYPYLADAHGRWFRVMELKSKLR